MSEARQPSLSSFFETELRLHLLFDHQERQPWWLPSSVVLTAVTTKSARTPFVMNVFDPLTT